MTGLVAALRTFAYTVVATSRVSSIDRKRVRYSVLAIWATLLMLYVLLRSWRLTSYGLWEDEAFSVRAVHLTWSHLLSSIATDAVHPPFFYLLLKLWAATGGATLLWLKLLPLVLSVGALLPFWLLCRDLNLSLAETTLALWLLTVNGYLIHYSQELRMYSLLVCISLWSLWLFVRLLNVERASFRVLMPLFMVNVLLVYTHYFGWLFVGTEWLCLLLWRPRLLVAFSVSLMAVACLFAPWAYAVVSAYSLPGHVLPPSLQWISKPGWAELLWVLATLNGTLPWRHTTALGIILFGVPIVLAFYRSLQRQQSPCEQPVKILSVFPFPPIVVAFVASQLMTHSMWGERYLIIVAIPYLLLVSVSLSRVRRASVRLALIVVVVTWTGLAGAAGLHLSHGRTPWKSAVQHLIQQEAPSSGRVMLYTFEIWAAGPLEFLLKDLENRQFEVVISRPDVMDGDLFWVAFRDPALRVQDDPRAGLKQRGCRIDSEWSTHDGAQQLVLFRASC